MPSYDRHQLAFELLHLPDKPAGVAAKLRQTPTSLRTPSPAGQARRGRHLVDRNMSRLHAVTSPRCRAGTSTQAQYHSVAEVEYHEPGEDEEEADDHHR